jgi:hypothetical protein
LSKISKEIPRGVYAERNEVLGMTIGKDNPVSTELHISNYEFKQGDIVELFDMSGKRVYSHPVPRTSHPATFSIDMSNFQSGTYILRIGTRVAKVVKQ